MIELQNINKYYKSGQERFHALKNINIKFPEKGLVFITGKSGSGKSTLLNIIGGIDAYDDGDLIINNVSTKSFSKKDYNAYRNTYIGFIFQEFNVIKNLTVYENIALSLQLHNESVKKHNQEILDVIEQVGLKGKEKRKMNQISGGERQRVAIARSLIKNPQVIIADEPTGNLDKKNRDTVMNILRKLAEKRLVLVVTHDKHLAQDYGDRAITLKDGAIINDVTFNKNVNEQNEEILNLKPISPKLSTSFILGFKSFRLNLVRYILIILLFSASLIFAGSVINLFLADTTMEYANYQSTYNNFVVDLNKLHDEEGYKIQTGFNLIEYSDYSIKYTKDNQMTAYKSTIMNFPIPNEEKKSDDFFKTTIERINIYSDYSSFKHLAEKPSDANYTCLITDYVADALLYYNYFGSTVKNYKGIVGKTINHPYLKNDVTIISVIQTKGYADFKQKYDRGAFKTNRNIKIAFEDNLPFYNAIYMTEKEFFSESSSTTLLSPSNLKNATDNILFEAFDKTGYQENVIITNYKSNLKQIGDGKAPVKPQSGYPTQLAISKGLLYDVFKFNKNAAITFNSQDKNQPGLLTTTGLMEYFNFTGLKRSPVIYNFIVTAVIDTDDYVIYLPDYTYPAYINHSFNNGGYLIMTTNENNNVNANVYRDMLDSGITINNKSFKKLQLVDNFIKDNIFLFAGLFFVFCLFSVLMIFNFIIINIKNSTRDIGIYMSLGMNGFKISMIYFFQVLFVSIISLIIGLIGSAIFLFILDAIFSAQSPINFKIIKYTFIGILAMASLAFLSPSLAVIFPLINLSRKKPIDVIKVS